jgi:hypothetical protein
MVALRRFSHKYQELRQAINEIPRELKKHITDYFSQWSENNNEKEHY